MDPDLAITIGFVCEVLLAGLVFAFYVVHEAQHEHVQTATGERRSSGSSAHTTR